MRFLVLLVFVSVPSFLGAEAPPKRDDKATLVRLLDVKPNVPGQDGKAASPTLITTAEELAKAIADKAAVAAIMDKVNFKTEKVLYFRWSGSGQDRITASEVGEQKVVTFEYSPGRTRDLRQHRLVFVLSKGAEFKVLSAR